MLFCVCRCYVLVCLAWPDYHRLAGFEKASPHYASLALGCTVLAWSEHICHDEIAFVCLGWPRLAWLSWQKLISLADLCLA